MRQILTIETIITNKDNMLEFLFNNLKDIGQLVDYLGNQSNNGNKFEQLLIATRKYKQTTNFVSEIESVNSMANMDDPMLIKLFISIVRLINHFSFLRSHFKARSESLKLKHE